MLTLVTGTQAVPARFLHFALESSLSSLLTPPRFSDPVVDIGLSSTHDIIIPCLHLTQGGIRMTYQFKYVGSRVSLFGFQKSLFKICGSLRERERPVQSIVTIQDGIWNEVWSLLHGDTVRTWMAYQKKQISLRFPVL